MSDIPTIDLRAELLDRHAGAIKGLYRLSTQIPIEMRRTRKPADVCSRSALASLTE